MLNSINLMGYLAQDPDLRATTQGKSVCRFTVANVRPKEPGQTEYGVDFLQVLAKDKTADFVGKWFKKGDPIVVMGRLQADVQVDSDGRSSKIYEIIAHGVDFVPKKKGEQPKPSGSAPF